MKLIFIVGPTAVGKTRISINLAKRLKGEIISADSMQAYRRMRILSQAPSPSEKKEIRHHLVGVISPEGEYNVAAFTRQTNKIIDAVIRRGKQPIVVGGSGLYVKALVDGLFPSPDADLKFRKKMQKFITRFGSKRLHAKLTRIDPDAAKKIHPNDARRIIRALELYNSTGRTMTELKSKTRGLKDRYCIKLFGLIMPRRDLYSAIDSRVDKMFEGGVLKEVKRLKTKRLSKTAKAVLGFSEIKAYLNGGCNLETAKSLVKRNTRRFAKRQLTWFRADKRIEWFDVSKASDGKIVRQIIKEIK